jgi:hypothetical protein
VPHNHGSLSCTPLGVLCAALVALGGSASASAQTNAQGIYTCIDSKGRRITSDRPIPECLDREQRQLSGSGLVRRVLPPSYTAEERAQLDAQRRLEEEQRARVAEEKRRDRALLIRYPTQASHDKERTEALGQIDEVVGAVNKRERELELQRKEIDTEMEFYQRDADKAPSWLRRKLEDNQQQALVQKRFLEEQAMEKKRINARFDEELVKLRQLWAGVATGNTTNR